MTFPYSSLLNYFLLCIYWVHTYLHKTNFISFLVLEFTLVITKDILGINVIWHQNKCSHRPAAPFLGVLSSVCVTGASGGVLLSLPYPCPYHPWMHSVQVLRLSLKYVVLQQETDVNSRVLSLPIKPACLHYLHRSQPSWSNITNPIAKYPEKCHIMIQIINQKHVLLLGTFHFKKV